MSEAQGGPRIEGGIDAVVVGASVDGLVAAGLLAKSGLHVMLIEPGPRPIGGEKREFAPGYFCDDGDPLAITLDPEMIARLDLYRHGLSFASRRLDLFIRFHDGAGLLFSGDPALAAERVAAMSDGDAAPFAALLQEARARAEEWLASESEDAHFLNAASASVDDIVSGRFADERLEDYFRAEAALGAAHRPSEKFTWLALARRFAGETAGLQGAVGYIEGGESGLLTSLRRAGQSEGVVFRQTSRIARVIVEWDHVAGLEFDDGGQVRAPAIVTSLPAAAAFLGQIGRRRLDIEFVRAIERPPARIASVRVAIALSESGNIALADLRRRFVFAPSDFQLHRAWRMASEGRFAAPLIAEATFPAAFDSALAPAGGMTANALLHPLPFGEPTEAWRDGVCRAARDVLARLVAKLADNIVAVDVGEPAPAAPTIPAAAERAALFARASPLAGYFFCGPEAAIARGRGGEAGRRAADAAALYIRERERRG